MSDTVSVDQTGAATSIPELQVETKDGVRTLRFNRADKKNAITRAMYAAAAHALDSAREDPAVKVFIITGSDGVFSAGNDLMDFMQAPPHVGGGDMPPVEQFMRALAGAEKPVIAAVDGLAIGIGVTLLLHCDLVYASNRSTFKTPFVDLALAPEFGSSQLMPAMLGHAVASELLLLGATWGSDRAYQTGLVGGVFTPETLDEMVWQAAQNLAAKAPGSLKAAKALMKQPPEDLYARISREGEIFAAQLRSPEFAEAAGAFMERRKPDFSKFD
ncbi:enoyl-CoA hydratase [Maricaulis sp. D1M11]|uniref:enoyl-CoA hydratase n=1 Tax=Maricaulis sp. D1M11 TaxID=3076117 RepID=UPI0039B43FCF